MAATTWWTRVERLVVVFMINQMPNRSDVASKFPTLVYQALTDLAPRSRVVRQAGVAVTA